MDSLATKKLVFPNVCLPLNFQRSRHKVIYFWMSHRQFKLNQFNALLKTHVIIFTPHLQMKSEHHLLFLSPSNSTYNQSSAVNSVPNLSLKSSHSSSFSFSLAQLMPPSFNMRLMATVSSPFSLLLELHIYIVSNSVVRTTCQKSKYDHVSTSLTSCLEPFKASSLTSGSSSNSIRYRDLS